MRRCNCTPIAMLVGLAMLIAAPAVAQAQDPFRSAPGPGSAMPHANPPTPRRPAIERQQPPDTPPPAPAVSTPPNLDRIREFAAARNIPLPQDLQIKQPGPDIPTAMARFSGVWGGDEKWNGKCRKMLLAVELIQSSGQAIVVHAESPGESFCYGNNQSSWSGRFYAVIRGDSIIYTTSAGFERTFTLMSESQMRGVIAANPDLKPPYMGAVISISRLN